VRGGAAPTPSCCCAPALPSRKTAGRVAYAPLARAPASVPARLHPVLRAAARTCVGARAGGGGAAAASEAAVAAAWILSQGVRMARRRAAGAAQQAPPLLGSAARTLSGCRRPVHRRKSGSRRTPAGLWVEAARGQREHAGSQVVGWQQGGRAGGAAARPSPPARTILRRQALLHLEAVQLLRGRGGAWWQERGRARASAAERRRAARGVQRRRRRRASGRTAGNAWGRRVSIFSTDVDARARACCIEEAAISRGARRA